MDFSTLDTSHVTHLTVVGEGGINIEKLDMKVDNLNVGDKPQIAEIIKDSIGNNLDGIGQKIAETTTSPNSNYEKSAFAIKYVVDASKRQAVMELLHRLMQIYDKPKMKLMPLRAAIEAGLVIGKIAHQDFVDEFGYICTSTFSIWTRQKNYEVSQIDPIISQFSAI